MSSYLTLIGMLLMVISPVLLPLFVSASGVVSNVFAGDHRPAATASARAAAPVAAD
jgi:hypothetical protein